MITGESGNTKRAAETLVTGALCYVRQLDLCTILPQKAFTCFLKCWEPFFPFLA